jgi:hypothetical protein
VTVSHRRRRASLTPALFALGLLAIGGCQSETPPPESGPAGRLAPGEDVRPPAARVPVAPVIEEPDCFVIVDADPDYGEPPLTVQFDTEVDCTGSPVTYEWDFGDGEKGAGEAKPKHVYAKAGDYLAVVRVAAPDGGKSDDEIDIAVEEQFEE